ncbi:FecR family protein [Spirosoma radiotolerans]|uniref:Iron dicitrate transport regulator FecR n=1 Tax=Spirosoma radiotolerans TaxID=1379870 RepID=A0A0E3V655_9BACT|nr:FecR family protein [Spirosoma radiotolerans]AKD54236.1 iron dicitrate transport regulator FecR [Spirosoma radiotolerans]
MQEYRDLAPEELALDSSFQRWQLENDPAATAFWQEWLGQHPDKAELVDKAAALLLSLHTTYGQQFIERLPISDREIQDEVNRLRHSLDNPATSVIPIKWFQFAPIRYGMAASILVVLGLFGWYLLRPATNKGGVTYTDLVAQATEPLSEVSNTTTAPQLVTLPDRSTIMLYPKSRVSYAEQFTGNKREIYLSGKGFFEVMKNPSKPFYVYANGLVTKVLGTSFTVQAFEGARQMKVAVQTGRVAVYAQKQLPTSNQTESYKLDGIVLTPNQQIVFSPEKPQLIKSLVEKPALLEQATQKQTIVFKRTPITDVFATLEQSYGIDIVFDREVMQACYLTASFADEPLFEKLDLICHTINASYKQVDGTIMIASNGCQ